MTRAFTHDPSGRPICGVWHPDGGVKPYCNDEPGHAGHHRYLNKERVTLHAWPAIEGGCTCPGSPDLCPGNGCLCPGCQPSARAGVRDE